MSAVSGGSRVGPWASGYDPAVDRSSDGQALQATSRTARIFSQELGKLVHMRHAAASNGEVVVHDRISLEFEAQGLLLSARAGEALLLSKEAQQVMREQPPAPTPAPAAAAAPAATTPTAPAKPAAQAPEPAADAAAPASAETATPASSDEPAAPRLDALA